MKSTTRFSSRTICFLIGFLAIMLFSGISNAQIEEDYKAANTLEDYQVFIEKYKPADLAFIALQLITSIDMKEKKWDEVIATYQKYKPDFPNKAEAIDKIINLLEAPEESLAVTSIANDSINTEKGEYSPILTADGNTLYFCRETKSIAYINEKFQYIDSEDIYYSEKINGKWSKAKDIGSPITTNNPEAPLGISTDGTTITLYGNYEGSFGNGDIFYSDKTDSGWSEIKHFPAPINTEHFDAGGSFSADGKALLFFSDRPGGIGETHFKGTTFNGSGWGNTDIYVCIKNDSGWDEAINLGPTINTPFSENVPYLHPNNKTLYFSSNGHPGLGSLDVFMSTRLSDTSWTEWSEPVNLGKEVNGHSDDWGYRVTTDGKRACFAGRNRAEGAGKDDIYLTDLPQVGKKILQVTAVSGKVVDPDGNPLAVNIKWNDLSAQKEVGELKSDPQSGKFYIALPAGNKFMYYAEKDGYIGKSEFLDLTDKEEFEEITLDIIMHPVEKITSMSAGIQVNNIFFETNRYELKTESHMELNRWVKFLKSQKDLKCEICGHTDNVGSLNHNQELSEKRARSVIYYLVENGIDKERLLSRGFGESQPITSNETENGRQQNRRVEIKFLDYAAK